MRRLLFIICLTAAYCLTVTPTRPLAQTQGERGVRIQVGASPAASQRGQKPELWAVVVGISRYQYGDQDIEGSRIANLKYAAEDAQAMSNFLQSEEGGGFREDGAPARLVMLRDEQATKENVVRALDALRQAKPDAYFVIYLAAHGVLVPQQNPQTKQTEEIPYFFLYDTDPRQIEQTALRMSHVQRLIRETPARSGLLLTDTCHSASVDMAGRGVRIAANNRNTGPTLAALDPAADSSATGIGLIAAAGQTESSLERDSLGHGVFTWCLLEGLRGHADTDKDGVVIFDELTRYLRSHVPRLTDNRQNPYFNTTTIGANRIALAKVQYAGGPCESANCGTLVVRAPDLNEVLVAIDDQLPLAVGARIERTWKLPAGEHKLTFTRGQLRDERRATIEAGRSLFYEINLSFSQGDQQRAFKDDTRDVALAPNNTPGPTQVSVHVREESVPQSAARELFDKGVASYDLQKFEEAVDLLTRAIAANNGAYADAFVYRGRAQQSLGRKQDAVLSFREAVRLRPTDYETRTLLAEARFNAGDNLNEVERELRTIIARHPNDDFARLVLADRLFARGQLVEAELQLRRTIRNRPLSPPAHMILADVLMTLGGKEAEAARRTGQAVTQPNAKLAEAITAAQQAVTLFTELTRRREITLNSTQPNMARVFLSGARYTTTAALAEANHALARALIHAVEYDDTQAGNQNHLTRARQALTEAARHAEQLRDPLRRVLVTETSARLWLLQENPVQAITEAETALRLATPISGLTDFYDPHYTLYAAYATQQDFARACDQLQLYLKGYGFKMPAEQRAALEDELKACQRNAASQLKGKGFDKPAKKKKN
jgi:uncharacterized caspase-like protein/tetratricopeptide (TPR) repeat protein